MPIYEDENVAISEVKIWEVEKDFITGRIGIHYYKEGIITTERFLIDKRKKKILMDEYEGYASEKPYALFLLNLFKLD